MSDELLYIEAAQEVNNNQMDDALWAKVMTLMKGNKEKAKYAYVRMRVKQRQGQSARPESDKTVIPMHPLSQPSKELVNNELKTGDLPEGGLPEDAFPEDALPKDALPKDSIARKGVPKGYIPVSELAENLGVGEAKIIKLIREGHYKGQIINHRWHLHRTHADGLKIDLEKEAEQYKLLKEYNHIQDYIKGRSLTEQEVIEQVKVGYLRGTRVDGQWYVHKNESIDLPDAHPHEKFIFRKIMDGDYGLAFTFFGFHLLGGYLIGLGFFLCYQQLSIFLYLFPMAFTVYYTIITLIGTWSAAERYEGSSYLVLGVKVAIFVSAFNCLYQFYWILNQ